MKNVTRILGAAVLAVGLAVSVIQTARADIQW